jgi:glycosyltransferase involved in cell wall biosynthesis
MQKIHLIHILGDATRTGAPQHVLQLSSGLDKDTFAVTVIGPDGPAVADFRKHKIEYRIVSLPSKFDFGGINRLQDEIKKVAVEAQGPIIVHCHGVRAGLFGRLANRLTRYRTVYTEHSWTADYRLPNPLNNWFQKVVLIYLDQYTMMTIGVSQAVVDFLLRARVTTIQKVVRIYNGITLPKERLPVKDSLLVGSIGSLTWQKNYDFLLQTASVVRNQIPQIKFQIIGDGPQREQLKRKITALELEETVELVGSVPHDELEEYYKAWSLYVQPSVNESFGLALAEAMAAGIPAIGARVGSIPELVGTQEATFTSGKVSDFSALLFIYLTNKGLRKKLRQEQGEHMKLFTVEKMVAEHEQLYKQLIT